MLRDVALAIRQTLTRGHRWHLAHALDAHRAIIRGLIQLLIAMHDHVAKVAHVI